MKTSLLITAMAGMVPSAHACYDRSSNRHYEPPCEDNVEAPPTPTPSVSPSSTPSTFPSEFPTTSPSSKPSQSPSLKPSSIPSDNPSSAPSITPTIALSMAPSAAPTRGECVSTDGVFGDIDGGSTLVEFAYELETTGVAAENIESDVLPSLELAFIDSILAEVFAADCGSTRRNLRVDRKLAVAGVSKNPPDSVLQDVQCANTENTSNTCSVVFGQLTLYSDAPSVASDVDAIEASLKNDMDGGEFNSAQENIVRVTYVDVLPRSDSGSSGANTGDPSPTNVDTGNSVVRVGLVVAAGFMVALLVGVAYNRRRKSGEEDGETAQELGESQAAL